MVLLRQAKLMHAIQQRHKRTAQVLTYQRPLKNPGNEVACGQVVQEALFLVRPWRRWDVQLDPPRWVTLAPAVKIIV